MTEDGTQPPITATEHVPVIAPVAQPLTSQEAPASSGSPEQRITPQDVEQARAEKEAAYTQLMDDMEASVDTQGQYFVRLGAKKPITETRPVTTSKFMGLGKKTTEQEQTVGYDDDRALILKAQIDLDTGFGNVSTDFTVVTRDGIYTVPFYRSEIDNPQTGDAKNNKRDYDTLVALTTGKQTPDSSSRYDPHGTSWGPALVSSRGFGSTQEGQMSWKSFITLKEPDAKNISEDFQRATRASIDATESPYKAHVAEANQQKQVATSAAATIRSLPPRV